MEEQMARRLVAAEGKKLQQAGLVARTWGNISCRIDENHFVITPSGLDYETMTARDLVLMDIRNGVCCGAHKPSSEKGVHLAAYQTFPEVGYVIHTHQTYATAIGLCGFEQLAMTEEEAEKLGGIARAAYGLSSTEKLAGAVYDAMQSGAKVVFMVHHGVLICGKDREEAFSRAMLLEEHFGTAEKEAEKRPEAPGKAVSRLTEAFSLCGNLRYAGSPSLRGERAGNPGTGG